jgi:hypothetical protein
MPPWRWITWACPYCRWAPPNERDLKAFLDAYLLTPEQMIDRSLVQERLAAMRDSRLRPFLEWAGLDEGGTNLDEPQFRERLLYLRCYLAEPDKPSQKLLQRLKLAMQLYHQLVRFLEGQHSAIELDHVISPLCKEIALHAPELRTLCYAIAEQMALVGEHSPEDPYRLQVELEQSCYEWLHRLHSYWHALLG